MLVFKKQFYDQDLEVGFAKTDHYPLRKKNIYGSTILFYQSYIIGLLRSQSLAPSVYTPYTA